MTSTRSAADTGLPVSRSQLEGLIQEAIDFLDALDADPDLEENGDLEPSLGAQALGVAYDAEGDDSDYEPEADHEPNLGAPEAGDGPNRGWWDTSPCNSGDGERELQEHPTPRPAKRPCRSAVDLLDAEAEETARLATFLESRCQMLIAVERQAVRV